MLTPTHLYNPTSRTLPPLQTVRVGRYQTGTPIASISFAILAIAMA